MHLYVNGDSFVAGTELGDDIISDYPGLSTTLNIEWYNNIRSVKRNSELYFKIKNLEYERSFGYKISKILGTQCTNNAEGGASMDRIARTTISDLLAIKSTEPNKKIVAIIGTTDYYRTEIPRSKAVIGLRDWEQININLANLLPYEEYQSFIKYKVLNETDYHRLINFYKNIIIIKDFCKLNNIDLYWISSLYRYGLEDNDIDKLAIEGKKDYNLLRNYADLKYTLLMRDIHENDFIEQKLRCPGGHFPEYVHDFVADKLAEIIKNTL